MVSRERPRGARRCSITFAKPRRAATTWCCSGRSGTSRRSSAFRSSRDRAVLVPTAEDDRGRSPSDPRGFLPASRRVSVPDARRASAGLDARRPAAAAVRDDRHRARACGRGMPSREPLDSMRHSRRTTCSIWAASIATRDATRCSSTSRSTPPIARRADARAGGTGEAADPGAPAAFAPSATSPTKCASALLTHARVLIVPSPYESLSIVLLEGWNHGVPALVNARCRVLAGQVTSRQRRAVLPLVSRVRGGALLPPHPRTRAPGARTPGARLRGARISVADRARPGGRTARRAELDLPPEGGSHRNSTRGQRWLPASAGRTASNHAEVISASCASRRTYARTSPPAVGSPTIMKMKSPNAISRSVGDGSGALQGMRMVRADDRAALLTAAANLGEVGLGRDLVATERIGGDVLDGNGFEDRLVGADEQPAAFARMLGRGVRGDGVERRLRDRRDGCPARQEIRVRLAQAAGTSMTMAMPMPPPMQSAATPLPPPCARSA